MGLMILLEKFGASVMKLTATIDRAKIEYGYRSVRKPLENNIRMG
jgi:hypothetical protein